MSSTAQQTLTGDVLENHDRDDHRPDTYVVDPETGAVMRRQDRFDYDGETVPFSEWLTEAERDCENDKSPYEHFDADETVGHYYEVEINRQATYRFRVPAYSEHEAEEQAELLACDAKPADAFTVHTRTDERDAIARDELPDEWDPYGGEPIFEVVDDE